MSGSGNRQRRQNDPPQFPALPTHAAAQAHGEQASAAAQSPALVSRQHLASAGAGMRDTAPPGYAYYGEASQFAGPAAVPAVPLQYQTGYAQDESKHDEFPQYRPGMLYNLPQHAQQGDAYSALQAQQHAQQQQQQQQQQSAAVEVLSSQFAANPQFYMGADSAAPQTLGIPTQPAFPLPYPESAVGRGPDTQGFAPSLAPQDTTTDVAPEQQQPAHAAASYDDAYEQYRIALRQTFERTRDGQLDEAGQSLLEISEWLLTHAVELGECKPSLMLFG